MTFIAKKQRWACQNDNEGQNKMIYPLCNKNISCRYYQLIQFVNR